MGATIKTPETYKACSCVINQDFIDSLPLIKANGRHAKRIDPTRTTTIQKSFSREINRRFAAMLKLLRTGLIENDAFGLKTNRHVIQVGRELSPNAFAFETDAGKLAAFNLWLDDQVENGVLEIAPVGANFSDRFIRQAATKGSKRANIEARKAGLDTGGLSFGAVPEERISTLFARTFAELQGLTDDMKNRMRRALADGIASGQSPRQVAREMSKVIDVSRKRALTIARTEVVRAHHLGNIEEMKRLGIEGIRVMAEWKTAGDDRVCIACAGLEGRVFTIKQIESLIPLHPNCRCVALPIVEGGLPPGGPPPSDFVDTTSDGEPREGNPNLFAEVTGGAALPNFTFPNQNPVTNAEAKQFRSAIESLIDDRIKANLDQLKGKEGIRGRKGWIGSKGGIGRRGVGIKSVNQKNPREAIVVLDDDTQHSLTLPSGQRGPRGKKGDMPVAVKGDRGKIGERGPRGLSKRGDVGKRGLQGLRGYNGKTGAQGLRPDHQLKLNKAGKIEAICFQRPGGEYGAWIKILEHEIPFPEKMEFVEDIQIERSRIRFKIKGHWTKFVKIGGGGGGGGIEEAPQDSKTYGRKDGEWVEVVGGGGGAAVTDNSIQGDGTVAEPLHLHGIVNGIIDESLVVQSGERMINSRINIVAGGMIDIQLGGYLELI